MRARALALLARRERSRRELSARLQALGGEPHEITALLDEFESRNWLSDRRFAQSYVADHRARDGAIKLAHALRQRGIDDALIDEVLAHLDAGDDNELGRAYRVWQQKFGAGPTDAAERGRQMRFLQGRGFSVETIQAVWRRAAEEQA